MSSITESSGRCEIPPVSGNSSFAQIKSQIASLKSRLPQGSAADAARAYLTKTKEVPPELGLTGVIVGHMQNTAKILSVAQSKGLDIDALEKEIRANPRQVFQIILSKSQYSEKAGSVLNNLDSALKANINSPQNAVLRNALLPANLQRSPAQSSSSLGSPSPSPQQNSKIQDNKLNSAANLPCKDPVGDDVFHTGCGRSIFLIVSDRVAKVTPRVMP